jgi:hypothetical protein
VCDHAMVWAGACRELLCARLAATMAANDDACTRLSLEFEFELELECDMMAESLRGHR